MNIFNTTLIFLKRPSTISLLGVLFCLFSSKLLQAQKNNENISFQHIEKGMSQTSANIITEDSYGFLWVGTHNGLNKYDGKNFKIFKNSLDGLTGLTNGYIEDIYEDNNKQLYIATAQGLSTYQREMDIVKPYPFIGEGKNLEINHFHSIIKSSNFLWLGSTTSMFKYNIATGKTQEFKYRGKQNKLLKTNYFVNIARIDHKRTLLITDHTITILDNELQILSKIQESQVIRKVLQKDATNFLIGLQSGELIELEIKKDNSLHIGRKIICAGYPILSMAIAENGDYWLGSENDGLYIYSKENKTLSNFRSDNKNLNAISSNSIWSLYKSNKGIMWMAPYKKGLSFYDSIYYKFKHIKHELFNPSSLNNDNINCFIEDDYNNLWIGTDGGGLNYWDRKSNTFNKYSLDNHNLNTNVVLSLVEDQENKLWVGSWGKGITILNTKNKKYEVWNKENSFILSNNVYKLLIDRKGRIWIATFHGGLQVYNPKTKSHKNINIRNRIKNSKVETISSMLEDKTGNIWIGTQVSGLYKLTEEEENWNYTSYNSLEHKHNISNDFINAIIEDSKGLLWVGTQSGLNKYNEATETFEVITKKEGLQNDAIKGIIEDKNNLLWLSTGNGIIHYNPVSMEALKYDITDGLQGNEFNPNSFYKTRQNELLFGGSNGFNIFKSENINKRVDEPIVNITNLKIFNKPVYASSDSKILTQHISQVDSITIAYDNSVINFEYNALTFRHPDRVDYAYFLDGFETNWNYVGPINNATYTNLEPGKYILRIKSTNSDGIWNSNEKQLHITVTPPFWETWWFRLLSITFLIFGIYLFHIIRVRNIKKYQQTLEKTIDERTEQLQQQKKELEIAAQELTTKNKEIQRFAFAISHDLKSPLSGIKGIVSLIPLEVELENYPELEKFIEMINISCDTMSDLITDITQIAKIGKIENKNEVLDINEILKLSTTLVKGKLNVSNVKLQIDNALPSIYGDRNRIIQVFGNLMDNAIKYMGDQKKPLIHIKAQENGDKIKFSVSDNGSGMDENALQKLFTPFQRFHSNVKGTGLGLYMVKQIIESHDATIHAESQGKGKGTTFIVIFPNLVTKQDKTHNYTVLENTN